MSASIRHIGIIVLAIVAATVLCGAASAETLYANETGWYRSGDAFNTTSTPIQHAVDNATSGDTVYIWNGSYTENVDISTISLTVEGECRDVVAVTAASSADHVFYVSANYVNITGIKATGASNSNKAGIYLDSADDCNISYNNLSSNHRGAYLFDGANNNLISQNILKSNNYGIQLYGFTVSSCELNTISYNTINTGVTENIDITSSNNNTVTHNSATDGGSGVKITLASWNKVIYNNFTSCWNGVNLAGANNSIISHNILNNSTYYGATLSGWTYNTTFENNTACFNTEYGFYLNSVGTDNNITDNIANLNGESGIHCANTNNIIINDNIANSNGGSGVHCANTNNTEINNNTLTNNTYDGVWLQESNNNTINENNVSLNTIYGVFLYDSCLNNTITNNTADENRIGILMSTDSHKNDITNNTANNNSDSGFWLSYSNNGTLTNNTANNNPDYGVLLRGSSNILFTNQASNNNSLYDYQAWDTSINNTLLNCDLSDVSSMMNDSTSQWIIKYTDGRIIDTDDPAISMTCSDDNCTLILEPGTNDYTLNMTTLDVTVSADTGSVSVSANSTLVNIDYINSTINDLNITALDRQLILESAGVQTMIFDPTNVFNLWNFEYYVNATANRKAVSFDTYTTNATNLINFTFYDLYPSSNFDCQYNSVSFTTNTSGTSGTLKFNKSSWTANVTRTVDIYMTTTPYRCEGGLCWTYEGDDMVVYLDLNDSTVQNAQAQVTSPSGATTNTSMTDFIANGMITWRLDYEDTNVKGTYTVNNFYRDRGSGWEPLDSFLSFESRAISGGGSGVSDPGADDEAEVPEGAGAGTGDEPEPEEHKIKPDKQFTSELTSGSAKFTDSIVTRVITEQSGTVQIDEFKINPTATSLIGGTRYGYADIQVPDRNIGGTICFYEPTTDTEISVYHLEDNEWIELKTRNVNGELCAYAGHFSYFALADEGMESVIESMTQLTLTPPKVSGILIWKWISDEYTSTHIANRELANVSASEGMVCEIITTGDYANRTLQCTYTPPEDAEWSSLKYTGEVIAIDKDGYTRRIPVSVQVYDMDKLGFPVFAGIILLGGILLYRKYD